MSAALAGFFAAELFAVQLTPETSEAHHTLALEYLSAGQTQNAEREFLRALALDPGRDEILLELASLHLRGDSLGEAERNLREYLAAHPGSSLALGLAGEVRFREKDFVGAERYFERAVGLAPDDGIAHKLLALCYGARGRWDLARPHLDRAANLLPRDEEAHYWRGRSLLETAHYDDAISEFRETLKLRPGYLKAFDNLGVCYDQLQRFDMAVENYRQAIELDRKLGARYVWPYINLASLLNHLRRYAEAAELLAPVESWDAQNPQAAAIHYHLGRARLGLKEYDEAERELLRSTQLDPALALPHYQLGRLYKLAGKPDESRRQLEIFSSLARPSEGNRSLY